MIIIHVYGTICYYYLCDAGYKNVEGFLTLYKGERYYLNEWRWGSQPNTHEFFNMKHWAKNVIERCFGILKLRCAILRSKPHYLVKIQYWIINACAFLDNFIRQKMSPNPIEAEIDEDVGGTQEIEPEIGETIAYVEVANAWS